ncbi:Na+/H+ antiporter [Nocardia seriolae]|uniref:Na(+)/H(+) exchanger n=1 Tax=Nocardia seriolae TaxID=37332 RepID=A0ABC9YV16_9NOCA|nr:Na+/H+ antiporter [Nocardia seriolae]APA98847.1 putative Na(+)/H(+) exchanger [Nocardia seriolae]OJF80483.1 Na+/H+ antiporter [Nocardia seriolae]PSK30573.1 Na+/H+ antiporter [Nocardia seriolae]QOW35556.1 Na+/H+ antiporter [Nocardia seriolae]QUN16957.1 Na+/H+ antiporter [Nocardia seriolae]
MEWAFGLVVLVSGAVALAAGARRLGLGEPFVLTVAGVIASYLPFVPEFDIEPELVLLGLLPPLLYTTAIRTSLVDFRPKKVSITLLSVGLVLFTAFAVGAVVYWLLPVPLSAAVAIGAIVAPPDAVAATAVARRVGMPRRIVTLLEGESLFNDATALVTLRTAVAAMAGSVTLWEAGADFIGAAGGGALLGVVAATALAFLRRRITDPVLDTSVSLLAPWIAYLPAEAVHASGVIAVVTCGLILGHGAPRWQSAASRIAEHTNWRTIQFLLESAVFLLIGLQVRHLVEAAWHSGLPHSTLIATCVVVLVTVIVARPVWVFPTTYFAWQVEGRRQGKPKPPWTGPAVVAWAGMRGVVTLAAALLLPPDTPELATLQLLAVVVVGGTLLLQGLSLPTLVRVLRLRGPSRAEDLLQEANLLQQATAAGLKALEENIAPETPPDVVDALRNRAVVRAQSAWELLGRSESQRVTPSGEYRRLRLAMLGAERDTVLRVRDSGQIDQEVLQAVMATLDLEESTIDRIAEADGDDGTPLSAPVTAGACEHLREAPCVRVPDTPDACGECLDEGLVWVHLRMCLTCGHVACCDSSPGNHATKHFDDTGHPVMRSVEPGESWRWCYLDELLG